MERRGVGRQAKKSEEQGCERRRTYVGMELEYKLLWRRPWSRSVVGPWPRRKSNASLFPAVPSNEAKVLIIYYYFFFLDQAAVSVVVLSWSNPRSCISHSVRALRWTGQVAGPLRSSLADISRQLAVVGSLHFVPLSLLDLSCEVGLERKESTKCDVPTSDHDDNVEHTPPE
ncbi:hypothetical protein VTO42DRAFT_5616 [Malbranchea cinnamomea]